MKHWFANPPLRYAVAAVAVGSALAVALLAPAGPAAIPLLLSAVAVGAWCGGMAVGMAATGLGALALAVLAPPEALAAWARPGSFVVAGLLLSGLHAAQRRLVLSLRERARRRQEFLATLSHELRNFLSPAAAALHVLHVHGADTRTAEHCRGILQRQLTSMRRLVDDLLDLSRIDQGKVRLDRQRIDLRTVVKHALDTAGPAVEARGHRLTVSLPPAPVWVEADPGRLEQVLVNLLTNAARYTEPGGRVGLTVESVPGEVRVRVRDTGRGLAAELLPRLFDRFAQAEAGCRVGLGVGLNLARDLVRLHGGELTAHSEGPGRGSEFTVRLPTSEAVAPEPDGVEEEARHVLSHV